MLDKNEALAIEPRLRPNTSTERRSTTSTHRRRPLVVEVAKSAAGLGAVIANYAAAVGFVIESGRSPGSTCAIN